MMATPSVPLGLPREMRLHERSDFERIKLQGRRLSVGCLIANWTFLGPGIRSKLGVVTSRQLGSAVVRSQARRMMREAYRLHQHDLRQPVALVLVGRRSIARKPFADVERDFLRLLRQAALLKDH
jgi:ribonuclease P protein component